MNGPRREALMGDGTVVHIALYDWHGTEALHWQALCGSPVHELRSTEDTVTCAICGERPYGAGWCGPCKVNVHSDCHWPEGDDCDCGCHAGSRRFVAAARAPRTHCKHGHEFTEANTLIYRARKVCRACNKARSAKHAEAKRAASTVEEQTQ